jgi:hypothetical protein
MIYDTDLIGRTIFSTSNLSHRLGNGWWGAAHARGHGGGGIGARWSLDSVLRATKSDEV